MHEGSIARNIIDIVKEEKEKNNIQKVKKIVVLIGKMHAVVPDALEFFFDIMKKEYGFDGTELEIKEEDVEGICRKCGKNFKISTPVFICPYCNGSDIKIIKGNEMLVLSIEGE